MSITAMILAARGRRARRGRDVPDPAAPARAGPAADRHGAGLVAAGMALLVFLTSGARRAHSCRPSSSTSSA